MGRKGQEDAPRAHEPQHPQCSLHPVALQLSASTQSQESLALAPDFTAQTRTEGPVCPARGSRPERSGGRPHRHLPLAPQDPPRTHQASRHRMCRRAKLTPKDVAIAGTFLAETIFATCHTLSLITAPGSPDALSRVRGEGRARHGVRTLRSHWPALSPSFPRGAPDVDGERGAPLSTLSCPHPEAPGWAAVRSRPKAEQVLADLELWGAGPGSPAASRAPRAPTPSASLLTALLSLLFSLSAPLSTAGIWIQPRKLLPPKVVGDLFAPIFRLEAGKGAG